MVTLSPRTKRHLKPLGGTLAIVLVVFAILVFVAPDSFLNSTVPTAFTLSISSVSILIALYSFTEPEHWYPEDIRHLIMESDPSEWEFREKDDLDGLNLIYKPDRAVRIETILVGQQGDYYESWMDPFPKDSGTRYKARIMRDNHEYDHCYLVWTDGKVLVPEPTEWGGQTVTELGYTVGRIIEMARSQGIRPSMAEQEQLYERVLDTAGISQA